MAGKLLTLVDYEQQRERAKISKEVVRLDYYFLTAEARCGIVTSQDLHWILTAKLELNVQEMSHTSTAGYGLNDKQWIVSIKAQACPKRLKDLSIIRCGGAEFVIKHHDVRVNWPCRRCLSPEHPTKFCKAETAEVEGTRKTHMLVLNDTLPSERSGESGGRLETVIPRTLDHLRTLLGSPASVMEGESTGGKQKLSRQRTRSPARRVYSRSPDGPRLPADWEQLRSPTKVDQSEDMDVGGEEEGRPEEQQGSLTKEPAKITAGTFHLGTASRMNSPVRGRSPTRRVVGQFQPAGSLRSGSRERRSGAKASTARRARSENESKAQMPEQEQHPQEASTGNLRCHSSSPKRRAPEEWPSEEKVLWARRGNKTRKKVESLEQSQTVRAGMQTAPEGGKLPTQMYIHQYLQFPGVQEKEHEVKTEIETHTAEHTVTICKETPKGGSISTSVQVDAYKECKEGLQEDEDFRLTKVTPATDEGAPLDTWLAIIGGRVEDVPATGHCGWWAMHGSRKNRPMSSLSATRAEVDAVNEMKKRVVNSMIAGLVAEARSQPDEFDAEVRACGHGEDRDMTQAERLCAVANHYAVLRDKSVLSTVSDHYWVRPAHLKAMAVFVREAVHVIQVQVNGQAYLQVYTYVREGDAAGNSMDSGRVRPMETIEALNMLQYYTGQGVLPLVLVLRMREDGGHHFQSVVYDEGRFRTVRNGQTKIGWHEGDHLTKIWLS